jgi:hypothetical protein
MPAGTSSGRKLLQTGMLPPVSSNYTPANSECYKSTRTVTMTSTGAALSGTSQVTLPVCPNPSTNSLATNRCTRSSTLTTAGGSPAVTCLTRWDGSACPLTSASECVNARCGLMTDPPQAPSTTPNNRFLRVSRRLPIAGQDAASIAGNTAAMLASSCMQHICYAASCNHLLQQPCWP